MLFHYEIVSPVLIWSYLVCQNRLLYWSHPSHPYVVPECTSCVSTLSIHLIHDYLLDSFITGIPVRPEDTKPSRVPRVFINVDGVLQDLYLLVYRALNVTVCALVKGNIVYYYMPGYISTARSYPPLSTFLTIISQ